MIPLHRQERIAHSLLFRFYMYVFTLTDVSNIFFELDNTFFALLFPCIQQFSNAFV